MSIFVDSSTRVLVQGITGREGQFHTRQCMAYGTQVVAGVTPGKGGQEVNGIPVFDSVAQAVAETGAIRQMVVAKQFADAATNTPAQYILYEFIRQGFLDKQIKENVQ
ncbi:MAG: hypothetical protein JRD39_07475, partial [Deltaproteobacteria bacterium]|nr:hypothetical protein [Deltaproteobacteria bacterium]